MPNFKLNNLLQEFEASSKEIFIDYWTSLPDEDKKKWGKVIKEDSYFSELDINFLTLETTNKKEFGHIEEELPNPANYEPLQTTHLTYHDNESFQPIHLTVVKHENGWHTLINEVDYLISKQSDSGYLYYSPNIIAELEKRYKEYLHNQTKNIHDELSNNDIHHLLELLKDNIETMNVLSETELIKLFMLSDNNSKYLIHQLAKTLSLEQFEKYIDRAKALLPKSIFKELISFKEQDKTVSEIIELRFNLFDGIRLRAKMGIAKAPTHHRQEISTHAESIHVSVDISLAKIFKHFAEASGLKETDFQIFLPQREIKIYNYGSINSQIKIQLSNLDQQISSLGKINSSQLKQHLNQEYSAPFYEDKDIVDFKNNLHVAKRFISKVIMGNIFGNSYTIDPRAINSIGLSLQQITAITYWNLQHNPIYKEKPYTNMMQYIKFIKEIMREYSNSPEDLDDNKCLGGTINHLVKALDGIVDGVTVALITSEDIHFEINNLWHEFLIEQIKKDSTKQANVELACLDPDEQHQLLQIYLIAFKDFSLPRLDNLYKDTLLNKALYRKPLSKIDELNKIITLGNIKNRDLSHTFAQLINKKDTILSLPLTKYLDLFKAGKVPYFYYKIGKGTLSYLELLFQAQKITLPIALECFDVLEEEYHRFVLGSLKTCFNEKELLKDLLLTGRVKVLTKLDPEFTNIKKMIIDTPSYFNLQECFTSCIETREFDLAHFLLDYIDINAPIIIKRPPTKTYPLLYAMDLKAGKLVKAMLEREINLNMYDGNNHGVLDKYYGTLNKSLISIDTLIERGIDKKTLLKYAVQHKNLEDICQLDGPEFHEIRTMPEAKSQELFQNALNANQGKLALLLASPQYVNLPSETKIREEEEYYDYYFLGFKQFVDVYEYPLHRAMQLKDYELIETLYNMGANLFIKNIEKLSPFDIATRHGIEFINKLPSEMRLKIILFTIKNYTEQLWPISSIIQTYNMPLQDVLQSFDELDDKYHHSIINSLKTCFSEEELTRGLLRAGKVNLLKKVDSQLVHIKKILESEKSLSNLQECFVSCFKNQVFDLAIVFLDYIDINGPIIVKNIKTYPLLYAMEIKSEQLTRALLQRDINLTVTDGNNYGVLDHYFGTINRTLIPIKRLLEQGIDKKILLQQAVQNKDVDTICELDAPEFDEIKKMHKAKNHDLFKLVINQNQGKLATILAAPEYVNQPSVEGIKLIPTRDHYRDYIYSVQKMVTYEYPLHRAMQMKDYLLIEALFKIGGDLFIKNIDQLSPLNIAIRNGVEFLEKLPSAIRQKMVLHCIKNDLSQLLQIDPSLDILVELIHTQKISSSDSLTLFQQLLKQNAYTAALQLVEKLDKTEFLNTPIKDPYLGEFLPVTSVLLSGEEHLIKKMVQLNARVVFRNVEGRCITAGDSLKAEKYLSLYQKYISPSLELEQASKYELFDFFNTEEKIDYLRKNFKPQLFHLFQVIVNSQSSLIKLFSEFIDQMKPYCPASSTESKIISNGLITFILSEIHHKPLFNFTQFINKLSMLGFQFSQECFKNDNIHSFATLLKQDEFLTKAIINCLHDYSSSKEKISPHLYHELILSNNVLALQELHKKYPQNTPPRIEIKLETLKIEMIIYLFDSGYIRLCGGNAYTTYKSFYTIDSSVVVQLIERGRLDIIEQLIDNDLDLKGFSYEGKNLLMCMAKCSKGNVLLYQALCNRIINSQQNITSFYIFFRSQENYVDRVDPQGYSALDHAINEGSILLVQLLLIHGAQYSQKTAEAALNKNIDLKEQRTSFYQGACQ